MSTGPDVKIHWLELPRETKQPKEALGTSWLWEVFQSFLKKSDVEKRGFLKFFVTTHPSLVKDFQILVKRHFDEINALSTSESLPNTNLQEFERIQTLFRDVVNSIVDGKNIPEQDYETFQDADWKTFSRLLFWNQWWSIVEKVKEFVRTVDLKIFSWRPKKEQLQILTQWMWKENMEILIKTGASTTIVGKVLFLDSLVKHLLKDSPAKDALSFKDVLAGEEPIPSKEELLALSILSERAYDRKTDFKDDEKKILNGYEIITQIDERNWFSATIFKSKTSQEIIVAIRWSDQPIDWIGSNIPIWLKLTPAQLPSLQRLLDMLSTKYKNLVDGKDIKIVWHSLGGALAEYVGTTKIKLKKNLKVVAAYNIDGPGIESVFTQRNTIPVYDVMNRDLVASIGTHIWTIVWVSTSWTDSHSLNTVQGGITWWSIVQVDVPTIKQSITRAKEPLNIPWQFT